MKRQITQGLALMTAVAILGLAAPQSAQAGRAKPDTAGARAQESKEKQGERQRQGSDRAQKGTDQKGGAQGQGGGRAQQGGAQGGAKKDVPPTQRDPKTGRATGAQAGARQKPKSKEAQIRKKLSREEIQSFMKRMMAEENLHRETKAKLLRLKELAGGKANDTRLKEIGELMDAEMKRHERVMAQLERFVGTPAFKLGQKKLKEAAQRRRAGERAKPGREGGAGGSAEGKKPTRGNNAGGGKQRPGEKTREGGE